MRRPKYHFSYAIRKKTAHEVSIWNYTEIQGDSGGKVSILGGDNIGNCEEKNHMCVILNGHQHCEW